VAVIGVAVAVLVVRGTTSTPSVSGPICPLTGTPAPGGAVPARPALAIKVGNYSGDRPSEGLNQTDIVFEEPVEGAITRLVAVFHCQAPTLVGDVRSAREPDVGILSQLSNPIFAHAGGIQPVLALLAQAPITDENVLGDASSTTVHPSGRFAPYATFVKPQALWALHPSDNTPPAPLFDYATGLPHSAVPGSGSAVHIPFSSSSDVTWRWDPSSGRYLRSYSGEPDTLVDGTQTASVNVVVMTVRTSTGPWVESSGGAREVEVAATGSGPLVVLEGGAAVTGSWNRSSLTQPATLTGADGTSITLHPGNTWVELVPDGIAVTTTAAPA
jgi:Protein of unknown function (DUF3048) N-terminal domain/Protein of unknown function (DUF3048) C-terminal domain